MVDVKTPQKYNLVSFYGNSLHFLDGATTKIIADFLEQHNLEYVKSKVPDDFDFFMSLDRTGSTPKRKYYGKTVISFENTIKEILKTNSYKTAYRIDSLSSSSFIEQYAPMLLSKDNQTRALGHSIIQRTFSYGNWINVGVLSEMSIYPFHLIFPRYPGCPADYTANTNSSQELSAFFASIYISYDLKQKEQAAMNT
mgnify:FL=1